MKFRRGQIVGYKGRGYEGWRGLVVAVEGEEYKDAFGRTHGCLAYRAIRSSDGMKSYTKDCLWADEGEEKNFFVVKDVEPTEEVKPTNLKPTSKYMEELGL